MNVKGPTEVKRLTEMNVKGPTEVKGLTEMNLTHISESHFQNDVATAEYTWSS